MKGSSMANNSKNAFMRKINGLLSDENLLDSINNESKWLKEKIKNNAGIIKDESNTSLAELAKKNLDGSKLGLILDANNKCSKSDNNINKLIDSMNNNEYSGMEVNEKNDDQLLGKRSKKLTNSQSAKNSRLRKRLYIELLEEKLKLEEKKNKS